MKERQLLVSIKVKSSADDVHMDDKTISEIMLKMEIAFNSLPTKFRLHVGEFKTGKMPLEIGKG